MCGCNLVTPRSSAAAGAAAPAALRCWRRCAGHRRIALDPAMARLPRPKNARLDGISNFGAVRNHILSEYVDLRGLMVAARPADRSRKRTGISKIGMVSIFYWHSGHVNDCVGDDAGRSGFLEATTSRTVRTRGTIIQQTGGCLPTLWSVPCDQGNADVQEARTKTIPDLGIRKRSAALKHRLPKGPQHYCVNEDVAAMVPDLMKRSGPRQRRPFY